MDTLNIVLAPAMREYVQEQVAQGGNGSASDYVNRLIREDYERKYREEIDRKLLEALEDGPSTPMTAKDWEDIRHEVQERITRRQSQ